ncbi:formate dehydrogenase subunit delta [Novosphingobium sp.]|uniref:formate dehydrogenase subunit delta n=1 Tax=Novosphingobium sp. TaxID=1874826 RepID=UPI002FDE8B87
MTGHTEAKLVTMINQIARNVAHEPRPAAFIADHLTSFWTPAMLRQLYAHLDAAGQDRLEPAAQEAVAKLRAGHEPPPQTRVTDPAQHGADAG